MTPTTLLIVDDHPLFRAGLAALLGTQKDWKVVAEAESAAEAIELHQRHKPDLTFLDLRLPDASGVDVILKLRKENPTAKFLILTTFDADEDIHRAIQAGALNYLLKGMKAEALVAATRAALTGQSVLPGEISERLVKALSQPALTPRELEVLKRLCAGRSNKEIAQDLSVSDDTVKWHLRAILQKLGAADRTQAVLAALQRGLVKV
jgi:DNA-binding NarL/FixJ family response regulator